MLAIRAGLAAFIQHDRSKWSFNTTISGSMTGDHFLTWKLWGCRNVCPAILIILYLIFSVYSIHTSWIIIPRHSQSPIKIRIHKTEPVMVGTVCICISNVLCLIHYCILILNKSQTYIVALQLPHARFLCWDLDNFWGQFIPDFLSKVVISNIKLYPSILSSRIKSQSV